MLFISNVKRFRALLLVAPITVSLRTPSSSSRRRFYPPCSFEQQRHVFRPPEPSAPSHRQRLCPPMHNLVRNMTNKYVISLSVGSGGIDRYVPPFAPCVLQPSSDFRPCPRGWYPFAYTFIHDIASHHHSLMQVVVTLIRTITVLTIYTTCFR